VLDHFEGTSGTYAGLDRFGRIVDQNWAGFGGVSDVDHIRYGYDYAGDRVYRQINPAIYPTENMDQAYTCDGLLVEKANSDEPIVGKGRQPASEDARSPWAPLCS
jgi:hypothetical protein